MAKIEVAVIEEEGGATHVKQTWTFKYGNRKRDLLSHLEKHHGFGALFDSDGDAIVSSDDFLEVGKYKYHRYQQVPPAGWRVGTLGAVGDRGSLSVTYDLPEEDSVKLDDGRTETLATNSGRVPLTRNSVSQAARRTHSFMYLHEQERLRDLHGPYE